MNSVHDLGGMDGFGPVDREADEPVFHDEWERRVFGMSMVGAGLPETPLDALRHELERLSPIQYLSSSYYERWLARMDAALVDAGTLSRDEIEQRIQEIAANPDFQLSHRENPDWADGIANALREGRPSSRKIRQRPRFAAGDKIVTRNLNPHGHTRLPRYARGKRGVVVAHHGAHVFPDANAHGLGENPQHLYTVRFSARELWGDSAEPNQSVLIDLWESYLEKDKAAAKSSAVKTPTRQKKIAAETAPKLSKVVARPSTSKRAPAKPIPQTSKPAGKSRKANPATARGTAAGAGRVSRKEIRRSR